MPRMARLIIYDTDDDLTMAKQLANSMAEGVHKRGDVKIMIINLATNPLLNGVVQELTELISRSENGS